ncbi:MAG TPA: hypothetical protein VGM26_04190 [Rhizomicrobium sp.]|jgi:hypothetical protein
MKKISWIAAALFGWSVSAGAEPSDRLVAPPYPAQPAWKQIKDLHNAFMGAAEWIPSDQDEKDIRDTLSIQHISLKMPASLFVSSRFEGLSQACGSLRINGPIRQMENGYDTAYGQAYCVNEKGTGRDIDLFLKTITGKDALYTIQRQFRRPTEPGEQPGVRHFGLGQEELAKTALDAQKTANDYLQQVRLCPADKTDCPATSPSQP